MDKFQVAHDVLLKLIQTDERGFDPEGIAGYAWEIADAMQAEADKRQGGVPEAILKASNSSQLDIQGILHNIDDYFDQAECTKTPRMANNLLAQIYEQLSGEVKNPESLEAERRG